MTTLSQDFPLTQTAKEKLAALKLNLRKGRKQRTRQLVRRRSDQLKGLLNCNVCDYKTSNINYISVHKLQAHSGIKQKCTECTYSHYFSTKVITHFKQVHLKIPKKSNLYTRFCDECMFQTKRSELLKHHKESVHEGIIYSCNDCNFQTNRKGYLDQHNIAKHLGIILSCDEEQCIFKTTSKRSLTNHKARKHGGILRFRCDFMNCLFGTNTNRDYMRHRNIHSKHRETKYRHFACTKTHTGEKPFGCSFCSMYFTCCNSLKRHKIVHTGERPFKCSQCNKTFSRSEHLKKHKSCQKTKKISNVKQIITPITIKTTRNAKMKSTKTLTVYRCPFYLCQFVISKQKFKETTEAVSHLMKKHAIDQNNFANAPKDKFKFSRVNINNSNKL